VGELLGNQFKYTFSTEKITEEVINGTSVVSEEPFYIYPDSKLEIELPEFDELTFPEAKVDDNYP